MTRPVTTDREAQAREVLRQCCPGNFWSEDERRSITCAMLAFANTRHPAEVGDYVLVPREPTEAMLDAVGYDMADARAGKAWSAMLAAAPTPPLPDALSNDAVSEPLPAIPAGMKAYGPDHPDYPNAPGDWDGEAVWTRNADYLPAWAVCDWCHIDNDADIIAYTPKPSDVSNDAGGEEAFARQQADHWLDDMATTSLDAKHVSLMAMARNCIGYGRRTAAPPPVQAGEVERVEKALIAAWMDRRQASPEGFFRTMAEAALLALSAPVSQPTEARIRAEGER